MKPRLPVIASALLLGACSASGITEGGFLKELPEGVRAIAAPYQDLNAVKILPEDGCYWYRHKGPVETTLLPLRTSSGSPICARAPDTTS